MKRALWLLCGLALAGCASAPKHTALDAVEPGPPKMADRQKAEEVAEYGGEAKAKEAERDRWRKEYREMRGPEFGLDFFGGSASSSDAGAEASVQMPVIPGLAVRGSVNTEGGAFQHNIGCGWRVGVRVY